MYNEKISKLYQELANKFVDILPENWKKVLFNSEVQVGAISTHFRFNTLEDNTFRQPSALVDEFGMDETRRIDYSIELADMVDVMNKAYTDTGLDKWNIMTFILDNTGEFTIDFEYVDLDESDVIERREKWGKKILKID